MGLGHLGDIVAQNDRGPKRSDGCREALMPMEQYRFGPRCPRDGSAARRAPPGGVTFGERREVSLSVVDTVEGPQDRIPMLSSV